MKINYDDIVKRIDSKVFEYISWLENYDINQSNPAALSSIQGTYSSYIESLLIDNLKKTYQYFESVLDQPIYMTDDYKNMRQFLIYWYAAYKTLVDENKFLADIDIIDKNLMLKSLGYTLSHLTGNSVNKQLLLNLANMYDIKGSPLVLQQLLTILGFTNFNIFEYWLYNYDGTLKFVPYAINDTGFSTSEDNLYLFSIDYNNSAVVSDPHWYYTEQEILNLDALSQDFNLPSLTPYIGIAVTNNWVTNCRLVMSLISRIITDQAHELETNGVYPVKDYYFQLYDKNISLLETVLGFSYLYNNYFNRVSLQSRQNLNLFIQHFNGDSYIMDSDIVYINNFFSYRRRPTSRANQKHLQEEIRLRFQTDDKEVVWTYFDCAMYLLQYFPEYKQVLDDQLMNNQAELAMMQLLDILNYFIKIEKGIYTFDILYVLKDFLLSNKEDIYQIVNFFKPYQARILEFSNYFIIDDKPGNYLIIEDDIYQLIKEVFVDQQAYNFKDDLHQIIKETIKDKFNPYMVIMQDIFQKLIERVDEVTKERLMTEILDIHTEFNPLSDHCDVFIQWRFRDRLRMMDPAIIELYQKYYDTTYYDDNNWIDTYEEFLEHYGDYTIDDYLKFIIRNTISKRDKDALTVNDELNSLYTNFNLYSNRYPFNDNFIVIVN